MSTTGTRPIPFEIGSALRTKIAAIQQLDIFLDIPSPDCQAIIAEASEKHFDRRRTVFSEFEDIVLLLLSGCMKMTELGANGQPIIVRLSGRGDLLGYPTNSVPYSSASTLQASTALVWQTPHFHTAVDRFPVLQRNIARALERQLNEIDARYREVSTEKVSARLSSQLVRLLSKVGKRSEDHVEIGLSQRELAQLTGTTLFTVSRLLSHWESLGIVSGRREAVIVRNVPALRDLARENE